METLIKNGERITHLIECEDDKHSSLNFKVHEVISWTMDNEVSDIEELLNGHIKWDGCSHIWFGDNDKYLHLCGKSEFDKLKKVLDAVWDKAEKEIVIFDKELAYSL